MRARHTSVWMTLLGTLGALVASSSASCSSDDFHPASGGSSGDASVDGDATTGGSAGAGGCTSNTECDDNKGCNGQETCQNGACVPGTAYACTNPDAAHCDVACVDDSSGNPSCVVNGKDEDGDQHLDAACSTSTNTADDCDDAHATVYPGASEICDGLDNDCDGKDEIEGGMALSGGTTELVKGSFTAQDPGIAWAPASKVYGVVWDDTRNAATAQAFFLRMSADGTKLGASGSQEVQLSTAGGSFPRIAWGNDAFGVVWQNLATPSKIFFRRFDTNGTALGNPIQVSDSASKATYPDIVATSSGWLVVWSDTRSTTWGTLWVRALGTDGTPVGATDTQVGLSSGSNQFPRMATDGSNVLVSYVHGTTAVPDVVRTFGLAANLAVSGEKSVSSDPPASGIAASLSSVAATSTGWALAWRESGSTETIHLYEQQPNGTATCSPTSFATPNFGFPGGTAARGSHRIVAYGDGVSVNASVHLVRFKGGCALPTNHLLATGEIPFFDPRGTEVSWNDNSAVVVWTDSGSGNGVITRWIAGPKLCDAPIP
jgi:Putative metal-binding motif